MEPAAARRFDRFEAGPGEYSDRMVGSAVSDFDRIRLSTTDWPIVLIEFPEKRVADAALHALLAHLESLMNDVAKRSEKMLIITDLTLMRELPPASQRQYSGQFNRRITFLSAATVVGMATVTPSAVLRGVMTAVLWMQQPPRPVIYVATRHEAMLRGIKMLEAEKVPLPSRLATYREKQGETRVPTR
jgi:hypothetical protein